MSENLNESFERSTRWTDTRYYETVSGWNTTDTRSEVREWQDMRTGQQNPRWKEQVRTNVNAVTPFYGEQTTVRSRPAIFGVEYVYDPTYGPPGPYWTRFLESRFRTVPTGDLSNPSSLSETKANNLALEQHVKKVRRLQTSFQGGTFVGELGKAIALIKNPASALRRGIGRHTRRLKDRSRRHNPRSDSEKLRILTDSWLEFQFGVKPLIHDIDDAIGAIIDHDPWNTPYWKSVRSVGEHTEASSSRAHIGFTVPNYSAEFVKKDTVSVRYISSVDIGTMSVWNPTRTGFAPTNWLPTLWEIMPWSFMIDYFSNIGDIISAATLARSSIVWTVKTVRKSSSIECIGWRPEMPSGSYNYYVVPTQQTPGECFVERKIVQRSAYNGDFVPNLEFSLPGMGLKWLNLIALANGQRELSKYY